MNTLNGTPYEARGFMLCSRPSQCPISWYSIGSPSLCLTSTSFTISNALSAGGAPFTGVRRASATGSGFCEGAGWVERILALPAMREWEEAAPVNGPAQWVPAILRGTSTTPALSSYFELMDRLIPNFLSTLSSQKIKGTRVLLQ